jgi:MFS family permease
MLFKKDELKHLWPFYLYLLVSGLSTMITPFYLLYFLHLGYSFFEISVIMSCAGVTAFLFEIPTGAFADGFSRKYSVVVGALIIAIAVMFIPIVKNYYVILLLYIMTGIGDTFMSGAQEAFVIDNLNSKKRKYLHQEYFIKSSSFLALGAVFAPLLGALLVKVYSIEILWYIYGFGFFFTAIIITFFTKENFKPKKLKLLDLFKESFQTSKIGIAFSIRQKTLFFSIVAGIFMCIIKAGAIGTQPFLISLGLKEYQMGYVFSIISVVCIASSFASRLFTRFKSKNVLSVVILIVIGLLFSLLFIYPPFFILGTIIIITKSGMLNLGGPLIQSYLHQVIPGRFRATIISTMSMANQLASTLAGLLAGFCVDLFGPQRVIAFSGMFGFVAIFFYQKMKD